MSPKSKAFLVVWWLIAMISHAASGNYAQRSEHARFAPIALSPELRALLAQDPIPDRSKIKALDHLLGNAFSKSKLLDWAHNLKPAVAAADPGPLDCCRCQGCQFGLGLHHPRPMAGCAQNG